MKTNQNRAAATSTIVVSLTNVWMICSVQSNIERIQGNLSKIKLVSKHSTTLKIMSRTKSKMTMKIVKKVKMITIILVEYLKAKSIYKMSMISTLN